MSISVHSISVHDHFGTKMSTSVHVQFGTHFGTPNIQFGTCRFRYNVHFGTFIVFGTLGFIARQQTDARY